MINDQRDEQARIASLAAAATRLKRQSGGDPSSHGAAPFCLAFLTDANRIPDPTAVAGSLPPGTAVILRDYQHPARTVLAFRLRDICQARGLLLFVGADIALANKVRAHGVHFPSWATPSQLPDMEATAACHDANDLESASARGVAVAFLSPVFQTASHVGAPSLGAEKFRRLAAAATLPVLALGGVTHENAAQLTGPNVAGLGAIGAFSTG